MPRVKKEHESKTFRIDTSICERLRDYCERSGQSQTTAVERAITMYIDDYDQKMSKLDELAKQ